jgi:hypothetical protein
MALTRYGEVRPWAKAIQTAVQTRKMPPWHAEPQQGKFANDTRMSDVEVASVVAWVKNGAPEGNPNDLPALSQASSDWRMGAPDLVFSIEEHTLGSNGPSGQESFVVKTNLKEDIWVEAAEIRPGNRKVVHHALVTIESLGDPAESLVILNFIPSMSVARWPQGAAKRIPAGTSLRFTIHYANLVGTEQRDKTQIGLRLARHEVPQPIQQLTLSNKKFQIPANLDGQVVTASHVLTEAVELISYLPRMRSRGKSMRLIAAQPDGQSQILFNIPQYDSEWQTTYVNEVPVRLPKGTQILLTANYDNSPNNPNNPDPSKSIRWGEDPNGELMLCLIEFVTPKR